MTALEATTAIRERRISARELLALTLERIDRYNPRLNAIVCDMREVAAERAAAADEDLARGRVRGPLHGVPITIKDSFAYAGTPSTWGACEYRDAISVRTAPVIERLEAAGAIVVGKTNVPLMLTDWQSYNDLFGAANNPWDLTRTAGGSSGGSSAALAAGLGYLTMGSDIAGSIRVPAHFCGLYGHKPTFGLVSLQGHVPGAWDGSSSEGPSELPVAGPLALSAADLEAALKASAGEERAGWSWTLPPSRAARLKEFRIGYVMDDDFAPMTADAAAVYESGLAAIGRAGARLEYGWPEGLEGQHETYRRLLDSFLEAIMGDGAGSMPHSAWYAHARRRREIQGAWRAYFRTHDGFLLPAAFTAAFPHDHSPRDPHTLAHTDRVIGVRSYSDLMYWAAPASLSGLPATVAPAGRTRDGLPVGLQIVGPMWEDATPIRLAALLEDALGGFVPPPGFD
jgi:amidase